ncbi:MAG: DUF418 domain-containing protein [Microbacterium sp.]
MAASAAVRGPVRTGERSIAPDVARGFALLFIAVANVPFYLWGAAETGFASAHPTDGTAVDRVVQAVTMVAIDGRTYPMFAFLFGYGIVQMHRRQWEAGTDDRAARRLLQLRNVWLLVFGFVHALLLWAGDVLGAYGLAGLVMVWLFLRRGDRTLLAWAWSLLGLLLLGAAFSIVGGWASTEFGGADASMAIAPDVLAAQAAPNYLASIGERVLLWLVVTPGQGLLGLVVPAMILLAFWAARRGILESPREHARLLRVVAAVGISVGWLGGVPGALTHFGVIGLAPWTFSGLTAATGAFAGLGYAALFGLVGAALERRRAAGPAPKRLGVTGAVAAVGRRSLSGYLLQSVLCAPVLAAWGLGLGGTMGSAQVALYAVAVWAVSVLLAAVWESRGWRGPAEVLLRRLIYPRRSR